MRNASVYPNPKDPQWRMLLGYGRRACRRQLNIFKKAWCFAARGCYCGWKTACFSFTSGCLPASFWTSFSYKFCCYRLWANKETTHIPGKGENQSRKPRISRSSPSSSLFGSFNGQNAASLSLSGKYLLSFLSIRSDIKKNRVKSNSKEKVTSEGPCQSHSVLNKFLSCSGKTVLDQT